MSSIARITALAVACVVAVSGGDCNCCAEPPIAARVQQVDVPRIEPRAAWHALPFDRESPALRPLGRVRHVSVHHTAVDRLRGDGTPEAELRIIQHDHRDLRQWGDVAYHFLIAPDGRIFAGRPTEFAPDSGTRYLTEKQWRENPIHTPELAARDPVNFALGGTSYAPDSTTGRRPGHVTGHITICILGNFMEAEPTDAAKQSFVTLAAHLLDKHGLGIDDVWLHREVASTLCPGDALYHWLRNYPAGERYALGEGLRQVKAQLDGSN
jgi:hypothetical protein